MQTGYSPPPSAPEPEPSRGVPIWLFALTAIGFGVMSLLAGALYLQLKTTERNEMDAPPAFVGDRPLKQVKALADGWARYRIPAAGVELDLPERPPALDFDYGRHTGNYTKGYFLYEGDTIRLSGFTYRSGSQRDLDGFQKMVVQPWSEDPNYKSLKFRFHEIELDGQKGVQGEASGTVSGEPFAVTILGYPGLGFDLTVEVFESDVVERDRIAKRVRESIRFVPEG